MFSKREGILVSKLGAETHGPGRGQKNEKSTARSRAEKQWGMPLFVSLLGPWLLPLLKLPWPWTSSWTKLLGPWMRLLCCLAGAVAAPFAQAGGAVGLYHVHPCSSSCFLAPQQAFVGEMGQKRRLVAASSYVFEKGRNFSKQVGR